MAGQNAVEIDFGAFPGKSDASIAVSEPSVSDHPTTLAEAWLICDPTADHTGDEHLVDGPHVFAGPCQAGVGFTIYGRVRDGQPTEPLQLEPDHGVTTVLAGQLSRAQGFQRRTEGGRGMLCYGKWTVGYAFGP